MDDDAFLTRAVALSQENVAGDLGAPFGAVVVLDGAVVGEGRNCVTGNVDPTAHAEIVAIRDAAGRLARFDLTGAVLYTSCEPCPMCLAAAYWARIARIVFANDRDDAARAGFDNAAMYQQIGLPLEQRSLVMTHRPSLQAKAVFDAWLARPNRVPY